MTKKVYPPGSKVTVADGSILAIITCVAIYAHGGILYEVAWWLEGDRHSVWLSDQEFSAEQTKIGIGFKAMNGFHDRLTT